MPFFKGAHTFIITDDDPSKSKASAKRQPSNSTPTPVSLGATGGSSIIGPNQIPFLGDNLAALTLPHNAVEMSGQGTYVSFGTGNSSMTGTIQGMTKEDLEDLEAELSQIKPKIDAMHKRKAERKARKAAEAAQASNGGGGTGSRYEGPGGPQQLSNTAPTRVPMLNAPPSVNIGTDYTRASSGPIPIMDLGGGMEYGHWNAYPPHALPPPQQPSYYPGYPAPGFYPAPHSLPPQGPGYYGYQQYPGPAYYGGQPCPPGASVPPQKMQDQILAKMSTDGKAGVPTEGPPANVPESPLENEP